MPPVLVNPDWDVVADNPRSFLPYCHASVDGFGATLEQEQKGGSICPIVFISRATLESERHCGPRSISRLAASSEESSASAVICGVLPSAFFRTTRRSRASARLLTTTGVTPSSKSVNLCGISLSQSDFRDFREHGPRVTIDDLGAPHGEFVARAPTCLSSRCQPDSHFQHASRQRSRRFCVRSARCTFPGSYRRL